MTAAVFTAVALDKRSSSLFIYVNISDFFIIKQHNTRKFEVLFSKPQVPLNASMCLDHLVKTAFCYRAERFPFAGRLQKQLHTGSSPRLAMCGVMGLSCGK